MYTRALYVRSQILRRVTLNPVSSGGRNRISSKSCISNMSDAFCYIQTHIYGALTLHNR